MRYLKRITIEGFQSHERTQLELSPGLNVITGASDQGKSAIIRALRWVFYNEPRGADFIRVGSPFSRVTVEMDDGVEITRERGASRNCYILRRPGEEPVAFEGFGRQIPEEVVAAHGVHTVWLDEATEVELHIGTQLEAPFLLERKGDVRAKAIGRLNGAFIIDAALKGTLTDAERTRRRVKELKGEITRREEELARYDFLPAAEERVMRARERLALARELEVMLERLETLKGKLQVARCGLDGAARALERLEGLEGGEEALTEAAALAARVGALEGLALRLGHRRERASAANTVLQKSRGLDGASRAVDALAGLRELGASLEKARRRLEDARGRVARAESTLGLTAGIARAEECLEGCISLVESGRRLEEARARLGGEQALADQAASRLSRASSRIDEALGEYRRLLMEAGRCPVCFGQVTPEAVDRIMREYAD